MQSKDDLEKWFSSADPWGYATNPDDAVRREKILGLITRIHKRVLDIGAGEGFILSGILAQERHAYELSDNAASRLQSGIIRVQEPYGPYDLVLACGILYPQYDYEKFHDMITNHASGIVITCNISDWEINKLPKDKMVHEEWFPYREYTEHLVKYKFA